LLILSVTDEASNALCTLN